VREGIETIKAQLKLNGRRIDNDHYGVLLPVYIADSREEAIKRIQINRIPARDNVAVSEYSALGNPDEILKQIKQYVLAGASKFVFRLACPENEAFSQLKEISNSIAIPTNSGQISYEISR
jgi:alkanesulfonate monooxygenase SsuD/methylene tetrahydromethanopterin reductase-like flavin-dependent oxidoreductase (luciferase family)